MIMPPHPDTFNAAVPVIVVYQLPKSMGLAGPKFQVDMNTRAMSSVFPYPFVTCT